MSSNKGRKFAPEPLSRDEILSILVKCGNSSTGIRNRAMITVMYRAGLRCSEMLDLEPKDLDPNECTIRVRNGKGGKSRVVGMDPHSFSSVQLWMERRRGMKIDDDRKLFCTNKGGPVASTYVRRMMRNLGKDAGIQKRCHPHGLRHTMACELVREEVHPSAIQAQLGHSSLATTDVYLRGLTSDHAVSVMRDRSW